MPNGLYLTKKVKTPTELGDLQLAEGTLVSVTGHCGKAPESRMTTGGKLVASVGVAVSWGKGDDRTTVWVNVDGWDDIAELLSEFDRGDAITVTGPRKSREYNDKTYYSITAWEIAKPVWKKREAAPKQTQSRQEQDLDDDGEPPPF